MTLCIVASSRTLKPSTYRLCNLHAFMRRQVYNTHVYTCHRPPPHRTLYGKICCFAHTRYYRCHAAKRINHERRSDYELSVFKYVECGRRNSRREKFRIQTRYISLSAILFLRWSWIVGCWNRSSNSTHRYNLHFYPLIILPHEFKWKICDIYAARAREKEIYV